MTDRIENALKEAIHGRSVPLAADVPKCYGEYPNNPQQRAENDCGACVELTPCFNKTPKSPGQTTAPDILHKAAETLAERGKQYDSSGQERSMAKTVVAFNAITGHSLTETDGWHFMEILKMVRASSSPGHTDSYLDKVAYAALAAEAGGK